MKKTVFLSQSGSLKSLGIVDGTVVILGPYGNNDHRGKLLTDTEYHKIANMDYAVQWVGRALSRKIQDSILLPRKRFPKIAKQDSSNAYHLLFSISTIEDADKILGEINKPDANLGSSIITIETIEWTREELKALYKIFRGNQFSVSNDPIDQSLMEEIFEGAILKRINRGNRVFESEIPKRLVKQLLDMVDVAIIWTGPLENIIFAK